MPSPAQSSQTSGGEANLPDPPPSDRTPDPVVQSLAISRNTILILGLTSKWRQQHNEDVDARRDAQQKYERDFNT